MTGLKSPIRILFFEPYPMGFGGNFRTQRVILERLDRAKFTPIVVSPIDGIALDEFRKMGVECVVISPPGVLDVYGGRIFRFRLMKRLRAMISLFRYNIQLLQFLNERQIDVVYANCVRAAMCIGFACKFQAFPMFLYVKGELQNPTLDFVSFYLSMHISFMSTYMRDISYPWITKYFNHKVDVVRGGIDWKEIQNIESIDKDSLSKEICLDNSKINTLVLGQLYSPKGQHLVIQALANLVSDHQNVILHIIGDEVIPEYSGYGLFLRKIVSRFKLENRVCFYGWRNDALSIISLMDIVINPSLSEGFGYVVVEAMALSLPVIASKTGITTEIIRDGENGFIVDLGDVAAIERRWRELLLDPELRQRLGRAARETVLTEYQVDDKVARLAEIWAEMCRENNRTQLVQRPDLFKTSCVKSPICVLFFEPYPMGFGGNFLTQRLILERLDQTKFTPIVVSPIDGVALDEFRKMGIECAVISPPGNLVRYGGAVLRAGILNKVKASMDLLHYNLKLARFLRERRIDVVYANCVRAEMSIGFAARLARVPSFLYIKGELANPLIDRLCFLLADKILFFCGQNRDDKYPRLVHWFSNKIDILKIGLDPYYIEEVEKREHSSLRRELEVDPAWVNTIVLGQLYRPKGQHFAIEALADIVKTFSNVRLYLVGDHVIEEYRSYKQELLDLVDRYGLNDHVCFTGWRKDALDIVSLMDIVIHPSLAEGFGRAVLESMALGKPVIASKVGGLREAIKDGLNGFLVEPGDVEVISQKWLELLLDSGLRARIGREAKRTVFSEYLIDDKVARLADIWTEMTENRC